MKQTHTQNHTITNMHTDTHKIKTNLNAHLQTKGHTITDTNTHIHEQTKIEDIKKTNTQAYSHSLSHTQTHTDTDTDIYIYKNTQITLIHT